MIFQTINGLEKKKSKVDKNSSIETSERIYSETDCTNRRHWNAVNEKLIAWISQCDALIDFRSATPFNTPSAVTHCDHLRSFFSTVIHRSKIKKPTHHDLPEQKITKLLNSKFSFQLNFLQYHLSFRLIAHAHYIFPQFFEFTLHRL